MSWLKRALKANPNLAEAHCQLGLAYLTMGFIEEGGQSMLQAASKNQYHMEAQLNAGNFFLLQRKFEEAGKKADLLLKQKPDNIRAQILLGNSIAGKIYFNESIGDIKRGFAYGATGL